MLWIKVVSAVQSVLLLSAPPVERGAPRIRARQTPDGSASLSEPDTRRPDHIPHGALRDFADDAPEDTTPPPGDFAFLAAADAMTGRRLLRAVNETGPVPPGRGAMHRALAFFPLSGATPTPGAPGAATSSASRTVSTHDLEREAGNLTASLWQASRPALGDDRWVSAGIAAWWALKRTIDVAAAASLLHRARSLAYRVFDAGDASEPFPGGGNASADESLILKAWIQARLDLADVADIALPAHEAQTVLMLAAESVGRDVGAPTSLEALYLFVMADDLPLHYDIAAIRKRYGAIWSPMLALEIVAYVRSALLPKVESRDAVAALPAAVRRGIDEAAMLFFTVEDDARHAWSVACARGEPSRAALRDAFVVLMPDEKRDLELLDQLFRPAGDPGRIHHDGITLRNALGRTFDDLLESEEMQYPLGMSELPPARQRKLLTRRFAQWNLSTRYPFGSVRHAVATAVERIAHYCSDRIPDDLDNDACLLNAFRQARRAWSDAEEGPSSADLVLAGQLAASNAVRLETMETLRAWFDAAITEPFRRVSDHMRAQGARGPSPVEWLLENMQKRRDENRPVPRGTLPAEYQWAIDTIRWQKERIAREGESYFFITSSLSPAAIAHNLVQMPYFSQQSAVYARAFLSVEPAELQREILIGDTWQTRGEASLVYANERMFATFGAAPTLDIAALAAEGLAAAGLNATEMHASRRIEIHGGDDELREPVTGSYVDAFLQVCRQVSNARHFFLPSGQVVRPLERLLPAVEEFNARLPTDPWIRAAALESFRCAGTVPSSRALQEAIDRTVQQHRIPSTGEILLRETLDIRNLIPFYASSKTIYRGLTEKQYSQVFFGVISLAGDIASIARLHPYLGMPRPFFNAMRRAPLARRGSAFNLSDGVTAMCGWPPSLAAFKDLKPWQELTAPPERLFDADLRLLPIHDRRPAQPLPEAMLPWGARGPIARARAGETGVKWHGFDVIFCRENDAVFLARHARANHYAKIDWLTLQPAEPPEFIRREGSGGFLALQRSIPPLPPLFGDSLLANQPTVVQVTSLLNNATDAAPRDFRRMFDARFDIRYTAAAQRFQRDHPSRSYALPNLLEDAYARSAIVRRVFHRFMDTPPEVGGIPVHIDQGSLPLTRVMQTAGGAVTAIDAILLPVDQDDASLRYQSVRGTEPPALARTVLHEFFHAWTRLPDPAVSEERYHRGGVVWLAEAALRQMGYPVYPRVAYGAWDERVAFSSELFQNTVLWSGLEDRLIEQRVPDLDMLDGLTTAYGVPVERRVTVRQVVSLLPAGTNAGDVATAAARAARFESLFTVSDARSGATAAHQTRLGAGVRTFIRHCATHSPLMRRLLAAHPVDAAEKWHLRMDVMPRAPDENAPQLYDVNFFARQVTFFSGIAHYLTHNGIRPLSMEMRVLDAAIARLTEQTAPARQASPYLDRGAVVWLSDRVLEESGYDFPKRLHRAMLFEDYGHHRQQALEEFARARWAAAIEDRYIADALAGNGTEASVARRSSP